MGKILTFELPDEIYAAIQQIAAKSDKPPEKVALEWLTQQTPKRSLQLSRAKAEAARLRFRRHFGAVSSGNSRSAENEQLDADLAYEYCLSQENMQAMGHWNP